VKNDHQRFIAFQARVAADLVFPVVDQSRLQSRLTANQAKLAADKAQ
jgi:hypothetical protein